MESSITQSIVYTVLPVIPRSPRAHDMNICINIDFENSSKRFSESRIKNRYVCVIYEKIWNITYVQTKQRNADPRQLSEPEQLPRVTSLRGILAKVDGKIAYL